MEDTNTTYKQNNIDIDTDTNDELFGGGDFVFMQRTCPDGKKEFISGGYKINSLFFDEDMSPIKTYNTNEQMGGKVSSSFENLAVPAGLFYVNMRVPKKHEKKEHFYEKHTTAPDELMDKLFGLVETDKKRKRKTRKHIDKYSLKLNKTKTRKHT
jgi:hypothetical protein